MLTPNEAYQYDSTFRRVVDLMCAYLSEYEITPAELRQAAILAATMHADRCIKPLYIAKPKSWEGMQVFIDEAKDIPPAIFGQITNAAHRAETATGAMLGSRSGRYPSDGTTVTQVDKSGFKCICGNPVYQTHTQTCKDYNWSVTHPKAEHCHTFSASGNGYDVCMDCGMSDVYYNWSTRKPSFYNWAYNKIKHDTDGWRDPA